MLHPLNRFNLIHHYAGASRITGAELKQLMRLNHVTIAALARSMGIPKTRVRYRREHGANTSITTWELARGVALAITR